VIHELYQALVKLFHDHVKEYGNGVNVVRERHLASSLYRHLANRLGYEPENLDKRSPGQMDMLNEYPYQNAKNDKAAVNVILFTREPLIRDKLKTLTDADLDAEIARYPGLTKKVGDAKNLMERSGQPPDQVKSAICSMVAQYIIADMSDDPKHQSSILNSQVKPKQQIAVKEQPKSALSNLLQTVFKIRVKVKNKEENKNKEPEHRVQRK